MRVSETITSLYGILNFINIANSSIHIRIILATESNLYDTSAYLFYANLPDHFDHRQLLMFSSLYDLGYVKLLILLDMF